MKYQHNKNPLTITNNNNTMSIRKTYHKIDIESFDEKKYFSEFHYYEIYNPLGKYTEGKFMADYGKGLLTYYHQIYVLCHNEGKMFYVVSIEKLFKNERFLLSDFCNCTYCQSNVFVQLTSKPNNMAFAPKPRSAAGRRASTNIGVDRCPS